MPESENEVIELSKENKYWEDNQQWKNYGDIENNYPLIGNQHE
ncbi:hypothetical protein [Colwellia sp. PAMC 21821]|nr:hypothetical protein [Colwellia sp. PAMC 21821]